MRNFTFFTFNDRTYIFNSESCKSNMRVCSIMRLANQIELHYTGRGEKKLASLRDSTRWLRRKINYFLPARRINSVRWSKGKWIGVAPDFNSTSFPPLPLLRVTRAIRVRNSIILKFTMTVEIDRPLCAIMQEILRVCLVLSFRLVISHNYRDHREKFYNSLQRREQRTMNRLIVRAWIFENETSTII